MGTEQRQALRELAEAMSAITDECWCAGWMDGTEDVLPGLCVLAVATGTPQAQGGWRVTVADAQRMVTLAERAGRWARLEDLKGG